MKTRKETELRKALAEAKEVNSAANAEIRKLKQELKAGTLTMEEFNKRTQANLAKISAALDRFSRIELSLDDSCHCPHFPGDGSFQEKGKRPMRHQPH